MVVQYHLILDNEALIINDIGRCASCHQPARAGDNQVTTHADPFAGSEFAEERPVETAGSPIVNVFDGG